MEVRDMYSHYGCGSQRYVCEDGDVILVSYPGCGVHWVQQIVQLILNSGQSAQDYVEFMRRTPFLDRLATSDGSNLSCRDDDVLLCALGDVSLDGFVSADDNVEDCGPVTNDDACINAAGRRSCDSDLVVPARPRTLRTHLQILRGGVSHSKVRYVYVARNPWDCCVSLYHRVKFSSTRSPALVAPRSNFDEFFDLFVKGKFSFGDYFDHVRSAYDHRNEDNVFFVKFEDLKADREGVVLKLGHFLGEEYGEALENCGVFANVCEKSSFDYMKRVYGAPELGLDSSSATASTSPSAAAEGVLASNFLQDGDRFCRALRSGKVNDWKEHFTLEHRDRMKARIAEKTKGSDLMSLWRFQSRYQCLAAYS